MAIALGLIIFCGGFFLGERAQSIPETAVLTAQNEVPIQSEPNFICDSDKTMLVDNPQEVNLSLSDGRKLVLSQIVPADGIQYTNDDRSTVFSIDQGGNYASLKEGSSTTYDCFFRYDREPGP